MPSIETTVYYANLDAIDVSESLSLNEKEREQRYRNEELRRRFRQSRSLLRQILAMHLQCGPEEVNFRYGPFGKPSIKQAHWPNKLNFNLSHSDNWIAIAVTKSGDVGIDIEKARPLPDEADLAKRFFHPEEAECYRSLPAAQKQRGFFNAWTRKEAILKARGDGLQTPLDSFQVSLDPREPCCILKFDTLPEKIDHWTLQSLDLNQDCIATLAINHFPLNPNHPPTQG